MTLREHMADYSDSSAGGAAVSSLSLSVALLCSPKKMGRWEYQKTELSAVAPCAQTTQAREEVSSFADGARLVLWRGLTLQLHKESCESYWANVSGDAPMLFVACRADDGETRPVCVTASGEEAAGFSEVDDEILSAPMPGWILDAVERFVITHYRPQPKKVRKRE